MQDENLNPNPNPDTVPGNASFTNLSPQDQTQQVHPIQAPIATSPSGLKKKFPLVKVVIGAAIALVAVVLAFVIPALFNGINDSGSGDTAVDSVFDTGSIFHEKDKKYALIDFKNEKRLTEYDFDSVTPFINKTALVKKGSESGIIKDDGSMLVDFSSDNIIRSGTLYQVGSGANVKIIDHKGSSLLDGYRLANTTKSSDSSPEGKDMIINPLVRNDSGLSLYSLDGKTSLADFDGVSSISDNFNYGNYTTVKLGNSIAIINNNDKKLVKRLEIGEGDRFVFKASSDMTNSSSRFSYGQFKDTFTAKIAPISGSGLLSDGINSILTSEDSEVQDLFVIKNSEVIYTKSSDECKELYTVVFPGSSSESVVCRLQPRVSMSAGAYEGNLYAVLDGKGERVAEGVQFYDEKNYIAVSGDGEVLEFYVDGNKVKSQSAQKSGARLQANPSIIKPFFWGSDTDGKYYLVVEDVYTWGQDGYVGLVLYNLDGSVAHALDTGERATIFGTNLHFDTKRQEIVYGSGSSRYKVQDGRLVKVDISEDDLHVKYEMDYETGYVYDNYEYVGGIDYGGRYESYDAQKDIYYTIHNDSLLEIASSSKLAVRFNRGKEPAYIYDTSYGSDKKDYYLSGKPIE